MPDSIINTPEAMLGRLLVLRGQMCAARQSPDGIVHAPPSDAELVLEALSECLASLAVRVAVLEKCHVLSFMAAAGNSSTPPLAAE